MEDKDKIDIAFKLADFALLLRLQEIWLKKMINSQTPITSIEYQLIHEQIHKLSRDMHQYAKAIANINEERDGNKSDV